MRVYYDRSVSQVEEKIAMIQGETTDSPTQGNKLFLIITVGPGQNPETLSEGLRKGLRRDHGWEDRRNLVGDDFSHHHNQYMLDVNKQPFYTSELASKVASATGNFVIQLDSIV